jgi:hypothetical protein
MSKAVSFGATLTSFSSGGGGALTLAHSSTIVWLPAILAQAAPMIAAAAASGHFFLDFIFMLPPFEIHAINVCCTCGIP